MITITLSAADATAHLIENPFAPHFLEGQQVVITLALIAGLGVVFLRGFKEAINVAVVLVAAFLALNLVVIAVSMTHLFTESGVITDWWTALTTSHGDPIMMIAWHCWCSRAWHWDSPDSKPVLPSCPRSRATPQTPKPTRQAGSRRPQAPHHRRHHHELVPHHLQLHHRHADPPRRRIPRRRQGRGPRAGLPRSQVPWGRLRNCL